jgi:hypothetical protein
VRRQHQQRPGQQQQRVGLVARQAPGEAGGARAQRGRSWRLRCRAAAARAGSRLARCAARGESCALMAAGWQRAFGVETQRGRVTAALGSIEAGAPPARSPAGPSRRLRNAWSPAGRRRPGRAARSGARPGCASSRPAGSCGCRRSRRGRRCRGRRRARCPRPAAAARPPRAPDRPARAGPAASSSRRGKAERKARHHAPAVSVATRHAGAGQHQHRALRAGRWPVARRPSVSKWTWMASARRAAAGR